MGQEVTSFGKYSVERFLEQSSVGVAYVARSGDSGEKWLIKVPTPPEEAHEARAFTQALLDRAAAAQALQHPSLLSVRDAGTYGESHFPFIAYELVDGQSLGDAVRAGRKLSHTDVVDLGIAIAGAVAHIHEHGQLHGSISPATILMAPRGTYRLTDLALNQPDRSPFDRRGQFRGEASYMAPEQVAGAALDGRADLFSLGVVLYELLVGELPYAWRSKDVPGETSDAEAPVPNRHQPDIPPALNAIVYRMIQKDVSRRPARASEVIPALAAAKQQLVQPVAAPATPKASTPKWRLPAAIAAAVLVVLVPMIWLMKSSGPEPRKQSTVAVPTPSESQRALELRRQAEAALTAGDLVKARRLLGELWVDGTSDSTSLDLAQRIKTACETTGRKLVEQGDAAVGRRQWDEASAAFAKALVILPDDPGALRGAELVRKGWMADESHQAQARAHEPTQAPAMARTAPQPPLSLLFQSPIPQGSIEVTIDGRSADPAKFDFSRADFMGMQRQGGGRVTHAWQLSPGRHRVAMRLLDGMGRPLQSDSFGVDIGPSVSYLVKLEMKDPTATPRFYLSTQTAR
ncbi:MAG TPA: serine/threonine-protein kinase [Thermoanaerobaculaceae bacterium]|nr:serine/threonine-protein kinase [Thermoanaerobaculaceae bacterium]HPS77590.1 serine/threonine-protein kinase [Thermoanaerobaculaceae bacterium]